MQEHKIPGSPRVDISEQVRNYGGKIRRPVWDPIRHHTRHTIEHRLHSQRIGIGTPSPAVMARRRAAAKRARAARRINRS